MTNKNLHERFKIVDSVVRDTYWQISKSGKIMELSVVPDMEQNPREYRLGVIQVGRIIQKIESCTKQGRSKPQIQLFPNLSEKQLAAIVHFSENMLGSIPADSVFISKNKLPDLIRSFAKKCGLKAETAMENDQLNTRLQKYFIFSSSNQPFIWLKTGKFIEKLIQSLHHSNDISFNDFKFSITDPGDRTSGKEKNKYTQLELTYPVSH